MKQRRSRRIQGVAFAVLEVWLLHGAVTHATTWHVTYDPEQPEDRVGAVAALAASGDSILIDPGTYYEHIPLEGKSLTFVGIGGPGATILDGSRTLPGRGGSIIYTLSGERADLVLEGLTFRNGVGTPLEIDRITGGAILWWQGGMYYTSSLSAVDCVFENNTAGDMENWWAEGGGAIYAGYLSTVYLERCSFSGNGTIGYGGDLEAITQQTEIRQCDFQLNEVDAANSIYDHGTLTIVDCRFEANAQADWSQALSFWSGDVSILNSQFIDHGRPLATRFDLGCSCVEPYPRQDVLISGNVFWNAAGPDSGTAATRTLSAIMPGGRYTVTGNTFVRCGPSLTGTEVQLQNNIVARAGVLLAARNGDYSCNDFWLSAVTGDLDGLTSSHNSTANPFFCDEAGGDFTLSEGSPCAPSEVCDLIGAEPMACDLDIHACCVGEECVLATEGECGSLGGHWMIDPPLTSCEPDPCLTPARKTTWGAVKALFRGEAK